MIKLGTMFMSRQQHEHSRRQRTLVHVRPAARCEHGTWLQSGQARVVKNPKNPRESLVVITSTSADGRTTYTFLKRNETKAGWFTPSQKLASYSMVDMADSTPYGTPERAAFIRFLTGTTWPGRTVRPPSGGVDEVNGRIRSRLQNVDPPIANFVGDRDIRIVERPNTFWNWISPIPPQAVRKVDSSGHVYYEIDVPPGTSEYQKLRILRGMVRRSQDFKKEQAELSRPYVIPYYPNWESLARASGATDAEIRALKRDIFLNDMFGPGGLAENAIVVAGGAGAAIGSLGKNKAQILEQLQKERDYLNRDLPEHVAPAEPHLSKPFIPRRLRPTPPPEMLLKPLHKNDLIKRAEEEQSLRRFSNTIPGLGLEFQRSGDKTVDFIDNHGRTYEIMGRPGLVPFWPVQRNNFINEIGRHLGKADYVIIDLTGFPPGAKADVEAHIRSLPEVDQNRIYKVGF